METENFKHLYNFLNNEIKRIEPMYDRQADYQTNSKSYYDYLAKLKKLFELLSNRIWEYDDELKKRFEEWDKLIQQFPENVEKLLFEWLEDGTLEEIINVSIFENLNKKIETIDKEVIASRGGSETLGKRLDSDKAEFTAQLAQIENKKATKVEVDIERKRIDSFVSLPSDSTQGNAEILDGRIGADNVIYPNLGNAIRNQFSNTNISVDRISELSEFFKREQIQDYNFLYNCRKGKIVKSDGLNSENCKGVFFSPNKNLCLMTTTLEYGIPTKTSNYATITLYEDGTFEYEEIESGTVKYNDIWSNDVANTKFPFDLEISCQHSVTTGGFVTYVYGLYEDGQSFNLDFVNTKRVIPKNSTIKRVYFKSNQVGSRYSFKVKINKADDLSTFEPLLAKRVDIAELNNLELSEGTNFFMPIYKNGYVTNYLTYPIKNADIANLQNDVNELKAKVGYEANIIEVDEVNKTIQQALLKYTDEKVINLLPNKYVTQIDGMNTGKKIIGFDKDLCTIYDNSGNYYTPPIEMAYGMLKNLTVIEENNESITHRAYALHIDSNVTENKEIIIENCKFKSNLSTSVGIGTRSGANITFKNCEFETVDNDFVFYLHNTESVGTNICNFIFDTCIFKGDQKTLKLQDWNGCNNIDFTFINNTFYSKTLANDEIIEIQYRNYTTSSEISTQFKNAFALNKMSHGNNVSFLNA